MITCRDCIKDCYPIDPRVKSGRYHLCSCDYCGKPQYNRDWGQPKPEPEIPNIPEVRQLQKQVEQARAGYLNLQNKFTEHLNKGKNRDRI